MEITCPACTKKNTGTDTCVRCGCDLSTLRMILAAAEAHVAWAKRELVGGQPASALAHATRSWELANTLQSASVAALAAAAQGDLERLAHWRQVLGRLESPSQPICAGN